MIGWLREIMGNDQQAASTTTKAEDMRHAVLDKPLVPPDGTWAAPLQQATFGLGWYVMLLLAFSFVSLPGTIFLSHFIPVLTSSVDVTH